jgi:hypothetical protein
MAKKQDVADFFPLDSLPFLLTGEDAHGFNKKSPQKGRRPDDAIVGGVHIGKL